LDDELIRRAQRGDEDAFQQLVERYSDPVWRTARVLSSDQAAAEDAAQEAWLDAWRGLPRFQTGRPFRPWLLQLVRNRCRMAGRRHAPNRQSLDGPQFEALADPEDVVATTLRAERLSALAATLAQLPAEQRTSLALRFFADLELAEIATVTGAPVGTVKSRLHRALARLREEQAVAALEFQITREEI
jgi:RNA polymerase sigma-70 factor (ECF subfamily)